MNAKRISVIITTFNGSKYINKQIESILKQSISPEEIIICDDNSTDDTALLLNRYTTLSNVKLLINDKQLGIVENFKKAAKQVKKGNWIVFADQDDIWLPEKLERLATGMLPLDDGVTPALIYSDLAVINKNDVIVFESFWDKQKIYPEKINFSKLLYGNIVTGCTMIINYPMAEEFFLINGNMYLHDEWLALIAYSFGTAKFLNEKLVLYRQHENNITFAEQSEKVKSTDQLKENMQYILGKKKFLSHQFNLAKAFLFKYRSKLNENQIRVIEKFIRLENKHYLLKRINRLITFS